jgi:hypothetical protein
VIFKFQTISKNFPYFALQIKDDDERVMTSYIISYKDYTFFTIPDSPKLLSILKYLIKNKYIEVTEEIKNPKVVTYFCKLTPKLILAIL